MFVILKLRGGDDAGHDRAFGGVYGLIFPQVDSTWKMRNSLNKKDSRQQTYHLSTIILVVIRERILPDKMTPVLFPIIMNYTLDVSMHEKISKTSSSDCKATDILRLDFFAKSLFVEMRGAFFVDALLQIKIENLTCNTILSPFIGSDKMRLRN